MGRIGGCKWCCTLKHVQGRRGGRERGSKFIVWGRGTQRRGRWEPGGWVYRGAGWIR